MGLGTAINHFGTFLLLAATALLIVVDISAPVVTHIALMRVDVGNSPTDVNFGTFGYCVVNINGRDECSKSHIGYNPAGVLENLNLSEFSRVSEGAPKALTRVMILHPIATGLCFIAFLFCLGTSMVGSLLASLTAFLAFIVTLVALICDFVGFGIIKRKVNKASGNSKAHWDIAIWLLLASAVCSFLGTIVVFFTCCAGRSRRRRESHKMEQYNASPALTQRRRHFWQRR